MIQNQVYMSRVVHKGIVVCEPRIDVHAVFGRETLGAVKKYAVEPECLI